MQQPLHTKPGQRALLTTLLLLLALGASYAQGIRVAGRVTGLKNEAIPSVTVLVKGSAVGTGTNADGTYSLTVPGAGSILVFSSIGYTTQEIPVGNKTEINVQLDESVNSLNDVVVVGYGTVRKSDLTGAVATVKQKELTPGAVINVQQALAGRVAGVQVYQKSGEPGSAISVKIRGASSITAGNDPLYVIDGMPINNDAPITGNGPGSVGNVNPRNPLNSLNPADIESIEVLKDASATAIYGSRGSNGVVIITTKRGSAGTLQLSYGGQYGLQTVSHYPRMLTGQEYHDVLNALVDAGGADATQRVPDTYVNTDWQKALFQTAPTMTHDLSLSGAAGNTKYYASLGYFDQQGVVINSATRRYSARVNVETRVAQKYAFGVTLNASYIKDRLNSSGDQGINENANAIYSAISYDPTVPIYNPDGSYFRSTAMTIDNPVALINGQYAVADSYRTFGNLYGEYYVLPSLSVRLRVGGDVNISQRNEWLDPITLVGQQNNGLATILSGNRNYYLGEATLNFNKELGKHSISAVLGTTYEHFGLTTFSASARGFTLPDLTYNAIGSGNTALNQVGSGVAETRLGSVLGRVNYSYNNRYLATVSVRADASSRFGPNNQVGYFPSVALAWKIKEESFLQDYGWLTELKLRASYGAIGNQNIGNFLYLSTFTYGGNIVQGGVRYPAIYPSRSPNSDLKWEAALQADFGLDYALLDGRLQGSIEYYNRTTSDLLLAVPQPLSTGYSNQVRNVGSVRNRGFEFSLTGGVIRHDNFSWTINANLTTLNNRVLSLGGSAPIYQGAGGNITNASIITPGVSLGNFFGYQVAGVWQTTDDLSRAPAGVKPGDTKYTDQNGDGQITDADRVILGKSLPDFYYGLTNTFAYKGLSLDVYFEGAQGGSILNNNLVDTYFPFSFRRNRVAEPLLNRWTPQNPTNDYPSFVNPVSQGQRVVNSKTVEKADYLRLQSVRLSYTVPLPSNKFVHSVGVFVVGQNLATLTKYSGTDPAANTIGSDIIKIDYASYPRTRTFLGGVNVQF
ncbi:MAG: SusC/RagA family TonB-linked outer membrane protein [Janthinobacterium lividum]